MRSRSALIAFVAAATTLALVGIKQPKTVALPSPGGSPESPAAKAKQPTIAKVRSYPRVPSHPQKIAALLNNKFAPPQQHVQEARSHAPHRP